MTTDVSGVRALAGRVRRASAAPQPLALRLLWPALALEAFLLALVAVAPLGGIAQSISPLARAWPWLLLPARALFGATLASASVPPDRAWPQLALFALLLVGASLAQGLALLVAHTAGRCERPATGVHRRMSEGYSSPLQRHRTRIRSGRSQNAPTGVGATGIPSPPITPARSA